MNKKVYVEPSWRMHSGDKGQFVSPPDGYEFITPVTQPQKTFSALSKVGLAYSIVEKVNRVVPAILIKSYLEKFKKPVDGAQLTYSLFHLVLRNEPWVVELENVANLTDGNPAFLKRHHTFFEKILTAANCKKIIFRTEVDKQSLMRNLNCSAFSRKIEKLNLTTSTKKFEKSYNRDKVKLLFVNSANLFNNFQLKGGSEILEAFAQLSKKYDRLELVMRTDIPPAIKNKYQGMANVRFIEEVLPFDQLEAEYRSADIFLAPGYLMAIWAIMDAMSYEMPTIATAVACASEFIDDGKTGFVIPHSARVPCYEENFFLPPATKLRTMVGAPDPAVVNDLVKRISILVENADLRKQMGKAARAEIERGRFSLETRNKNLKRILDEATGTPG